MCDGTNGTPDLRNRFIVGAGSNYSVGATGGRDTVTLTTGQMPKHTHNVYTANASAGSSTEKGFSTGITTYTVGAVATSSVGSGEAHENRPPVLRALLYYEALTTKNDRYDYKIEGLLDGNSSF
jgi:microcystin-dependent protein